MMFGVFVVGTLYITKWAAKTKSAADFYTAGGGITGFQNGLAIAGDYMSAASFLGISAAVMASGYDGLIYSIGFLVGWPVVITFLMAERLRNLGKFTFADVAAYRFEQDPDPRLRGPGTLVVVAFYLIAQMVGAGQLIKLLFGLEYWMAVVIVGALMMIYVLFGGMTATTWVQIIKACLLLCRRHLHGLHGAAAHYGFARGAVRRRGRQDRGRHRQGHDGRGCRQLGQSIMGPGSFIKDPISAISFGMALMFGTAGLPHMLMRFFTVPDAKEARKSVFWATTWIGYFYILTFIIGFGAIVLVSTNPGLPGCQGRPDRRQQHGGDPPRQRGRRQRVPRLHLGGGVRDHPRGGGWPDPVGCLGGVARPVRHRVQEGQRRLGAELRVSRITTMVLGVIAVVLGIAFEKQNIAFMVSLAFAIAACSANFPVLFMSVLWKDCTTRGATIGGFIGLIVAQSLTIVALGGKPRWATRRVRAVPHASPALFSMACGLHRHLAVLDPRQQRACQGRPCRLHGAEGAFGDRHRRGVGLGALSSKRPPASARVPAGSNKDRGRWAQAHRPAVFP